MAHGELPKIEAKSKSSLKLLPSKFDDDTEQFEDSILPYHMEYLTSNMEHELRHMLKETEEVKEKGLRMLRELLKKEENLLWRDEDNFLLQFLRARKYDIKKSFQLLKNYYKFRKEYTDIFSTSQASKVKEVIMANFSGFLTKRDNQGSVVMILKLGMWNPDEYGFEDVFKTISAYLCHAIEIPATQVTGFRIIIDFRDITWKQVKFCTPQNIILMVRSTQFCFPARYKGIHFLCENPLFNLVWSVVYPLLTSKLKRRVHFHGKKLDDIQKYIDSSILPQEFGGSAETFDNASWSKRIDNDQDKLLSMLQYGYK